MDKINELGIKLQDFYAGDSISKRLDKVVLPQKSATKWTCYSDYCFGDIHKPNDTISFVLMPYESEEDYLTIQDFIKRKQSKDLKEVNTVNSAFMTFVRDRGFIIFAYILDDFEKWLGDNEDTQRVNIKACLQLYKKQFEIWRDTAQNEKVKSHFNSLSTQIETICSKRLKKSELKTYIEMLLVAVIGSISMSEVAKRLDNVDKLGWFSDRDDILDKGQGLICNIFHTNLFNVMQQQDFEFVTYKNDSSIKPFFDHFNRISDIVTGTLADYNVAANVVTKKKFGKVLRQLFADNPCLFVNRLKFSKSIRLSDIVMSLKK